MADALHGKNGDPVFVFIRTAAGILGSRQEQLRIFGHMFSEREKSLAKAWLAGYIFHAALDITLHPAIYSLSGNYYDSNMEQRRQAVMRHRLIETALDLFVLGSKEKPREFIRREIRYPKNKDKSFLLRYYAASLAGFAGVRGEEEKKFMEKWVQTARTALSKMKFYSWLFSQINADSINKYVKRMLPPSLHGDLAMFYPNLLYRDYSLLPGSFLPEKVTSYVDPVLGETRSINFGSAYKSAYRLALQMMREFNLVISGQSLPTSAVLLKDLSLNNGRSKIPVDAMKHFQPVSFEGRIP